MCGYISYNAALAEKVPAIAPKALARLEIQGELHHVAYRAWHVQLCADTTGTARPHTCPAREEPETSV
jgi:hypothetical protein